MQELKRTLVQLQDDLAAALKQLHFDDLEREERDLREQMSHPDFWDDSGRAAEAGKRQAQLEKRLQPWRLLQQSVSDLAELADLDDPSLADELQTNLHNLTEQFNSLKNDLKLTRPYDEYDAIVSIYAGAGGTDAQDWAGMLLRMYVRWAERQGFSIRTDDETPGEEAGIKSVTIEISGPFAYGKLKGEHGVHRLVRLSPFNADNLRQTSFAKVEVMPKINRPDEFVIDEKDLKIDVYRSGGHGGQSVNTTDSAVRITHIPTGITVAIQNERSQLQNKETALTILRSRLAQLQLEQHKERLDELKGPSQSAEWGNQIRSYVLHPYKQVKDLRTRFETSDVDTVLDGDLDGLIDAYLEHNLNI